MTFDAKIGNTTIVLPDSARALVKMPDPNLPGPSPAWVQFMGIPYEQRDSVISDKRTFIPAIAKVNWVYKCCEFIAKNSVQVPLRLYSGTKKNRTEIEDHPILKLLDDVNPFSMNGSDLKRAIFYAMMLRGENFIQVVRNRAGLPAEFYWRSPDRMIPIPDQKTFVSGYKFNTGKSMITLAPKDVYWFRFFNPMDEYSGLSPLEALRQSVNIDSSAQTVQQSLYKNGGLARGIISPEMNRDGVPLPKTEVTQLREDWREKMGGSANAHSIAFMGAPVKFQDLTLSEDAISWLSVREVSRMEICAAYGIPLELATSEAKSYDNLRSARLSFWQETMLPNLRWYEEQLKWTLVREWDPDGSLGLHLEHDTSNVAALMPDWSEQHMADMEDLRLYRKTINEIRERDGEDPLPWGDAMWGPWSTVDLWLGKGQPIPRISQTISAQASADVTPVLAEGQEAVDKPDPAEQAGAVAAATAPFNNPAGDNPKRASGSARKASARVVRTPEQRAALGREHAAQINRVASAMSEDVRNAFDVQMREIIARMPAKRKQITSVEALLVSAEPGLMEAMLNAVTDIGEAAYGSVVDQISRGSKGRKDDMTIQFRLDNPNLQALVAQLGQRITAIDQNTLSDVRDMIGEGMRRGYSVSQIADGVSKEGYHGIRGLFEETYKGRSDTIARTETSWVFNRAAVVGMRESQVVEQKEWMLGIGDDAMHCDDLDGEIVGIDEAFSDGSYAPPDPHPNCTCSILPVVNVEQVADEEALQEAVRSVPTRKDAVTAVLAEARALLGRVA